MSKTNLMKICSVVLTLVMCLSTFGGLFVFADDGQGTDTPRTVSTWDGTSVDTEWESAGTNAYYITSAAELAGLAKVVDEATETTKVNPGVYSGVTFYITVDIDLAGFEWNPIGDHNTTAFGGSLIGCYGNAQCTHAYDAATGVSACAPVTISNMKMSIDNAEKGENKGLIGRKAGGAVMNITMVNPYIYTTAQSTGFIVGYSPDIATTYANLRVEGGKIDTKGGARTSGLVGYNNHQPDQVINCYSETTITVLQDSAKLGGMLGENNGGMCFKNCETKFTIANPDLYKVTKAGGISMGGNTSGKSVTFENCKAEVNMISNGSGGEQLLTGINGYTSGGTPIGGTTYTNCTATGSIILMAPNGAACNIGHTFGGVAGSTQGTSSLTNCVSMVDIIVVGSAANNNFHAGGLVGQIKADTILTNCYYGGSIIASSGKRVGGMAGLLGATARFVNCQMDGVVDVNSSQNGAWIGRWDLNGKNIFLENCVVTGISRSSYANGYAWVGTAANYSTDSSDAIGTFNVVGGVYSNATVPFVGWNDYDVTKENSCVSFKIGTADAVPVTNTKNGAYAGYFAESLAGTVTLPEEFWTVEAGKAPVLKLAADVYDDTYAEADMSWFAPMSNTTFVLKDDADMLGLAALSRLTPLAKENFNFVLNDAETLLAAIADDKFAEDFWFNVADNVVMSYGDYAVEVNTLDVKYQMKDITETGASLRLLATVDANLDLYTKVGFEITDATGKVTTLEAGSVYTSVLVPDSTDEGTDADVVEAAGISSAKTAKYIVAIETGAVASTDVLTIRAFVEMKDGTVVYGDAATATIAGMMQTTAINNKVTEMAVAWADLVATVEVTDGVEITELNKTTYNNIVAAVKAATTQAEIATQAQAFADLCATILPAA